LETRLVIFRGRVQGVGFRFTTTRISRGHQVSGYVRNLSDGTVELVAQGDGGSIDAFVDEICGAMEGYVSDVQSRPHETDEDFEDFSVRH